MLINGPEEDDEINDDGECPEETHEEAVVEVPEEFVGPVVDILGSRRGQMVDLITSDQGLTRVTYTIPTR